jgi:hypothetical protein
MIRCGYSALHHELENKKHMDLTKLKKGTLIFHEEWGVRQIKYVFDDTNPPSYDIFGNGHLPVKSSDSRLQEAVIISTK